MAKSKYDTHVKPKLDLIEGWARDGLTDEQIAEGLGIHVSTLYDYKNKYPEFSEALKNGKEVVDYQVEKALLTKALRGDVTAQIFWLKNRKPKQWRDRKEHGEIDIATKEYNLKKRKLEMEEKKLNEDNKDKSIQIKIVKASEAQCKK